MAYGYVDKSKMTVTMSLAEYEYYASAEQRLDKFFEMLARANKDGNAVMTDELRTEIQRLKDYIVD